MSDLSPSSSCKLGQKEFWNEFYSTELDNFDEFGDVGDIWFGRKNLERILKWLVDNNISKKSGVLDVGCGNGMTLVTLVKSGFEDLTGVDYAEEAILLAQKIADDKGFNIKYEALDFLNISENFSSCISRQFDLIIDKGTYDAICLHPDSAKRRQLYVQQMHRRLSPNGHFLLISCNWTKEELLSHFTGLHLHEEIAIPSFGFGGGTGQTVTALVMKISS